MKNLAHKTLLAVLAIALAAVPMDAQHRGGGGGSRGGGGSHGGGGGGSHHSSSMSSPSRGGGSSYHGGSSHSSSGRSSSMSSGSRSSSHSSSRSYSQPSRPSTRQSSPSRSYSQPSRPSTRSNNPAYSSPQRQGSTYGQRGRAVPQSGGANGAVRQSPRQVTPGTRAGQAPQRRVQPQQGVQSRMGNPGARAVARPAPGTTRSFNGGAQPSRVNMHPNPGHGVDRIHPRHREPMPFNRPARFWAHGPHYFGYRIGYLPPRYHIHHYWGRDYYYLDGLYYRYYLDHYYVCRPPFGVFFDPLLDDIAYVACNFAYYASVYNAFSTINDNARTITEQNEVIAMNNATIAQQNADIAMNSERAIAAQQTADNLGLVQSYADASVEYFYDDGVFFTKGKDGKYVTIVPPAGALVKELPEDYEVITLNGSEYYKVDETVYRATVVDGSACFEVLGQMTGALAQQFETE